MTKRFRVWDSADECWIDSSHLRCNVDGYLYLPYGLAPQRNIKRFTIQQWTGLTDSQGVEIHEGDILEFLGPEDFSAHYGKVFFEDGMFKATEHGTLYSWRKWITVVGNIFQNPELLEKC